MEVYNIQREIKKEQHGSIYKWTLNPLDVGLNLQ